jgi:hypothetical protein
MGQQAQFGVACFVSPRIAGTFRQNIPALPQSSVSTLQLACACFNNSANIRGVFVVTCEKCHFTLWLARNAHLASINHLSSEIRRLVTTP